MTSSSSSSSSGGSGTPGRHKGCAVEPRQPAEPWGFLGLALGLFAARGRRRVSKAPSR
jgi:MYXO-CTERM domain-containing protein